jgi:hypothetical protein
VHGAIARSFEKILAGQILYWLGGLWTVAADSWLIPFVLMTLMPVKTTVGF